MARRRAAARHCLSRVQLAWNDDAVGLDSRLSFTVMTSGLYYLTAQGFGTTTGGYRLSMTQTLTNVALTGTAANDILTAAAGADTIFGLAGHDVLSGLGGADLLDGGSGHDQLNGDAGNDVLVGGAGRDEMTGGAGADTFRFLELADSVADANRDLIVDFNRSQSDRIDLSAIDANIDAVGDQAFAFIGGAAFGRVAGQLRFSAGIVQADVDGDGRADLEIAVRGVTSLLSSDFTL